ncbi:MAG TPA: histidine phosphatase family protein [Kofleriaceae bacterium]
MRKILLARHGRTSWNALGRLQGHTDIELDEIGRGQARALADAVQNAGISRVWSSDLLRAHETARIVAEALGVTHEVDPELRERKFGVFEGLTRDECQTQHPEAWRNWVGQTLHPPGGEPKAEAVVRMARALARIVGDDTALVVTHGGVMRLWLMDVLGATIPLVGNATMYEVDHDDRGFRAKLRA